MSIAKALSSAYLPISAVLLSPELSEIIEQESGKIGTFGHGFTYTGHPVAAAVALKTIEIYQARDIVGHVRQVAPLFQSGCSALADHPLVGEAVGVGLIGAVELVADKTDEAELRSREAGRRDGRRVSREEEGLIVRPLLGDRIAFCPPLVIDEAEIDELFDRFERALEEGPRLGDEGKIAGRERLLTCHATMDARCIPSRKVRWTRCAASAQSRSIAKLALSASPLRRGG